MTKILIVAEVKNGEIKKNTLELLSLAKSHGFESDAVLLGTDVSGLADTLAGHVFIPCSASINTEIWKGLCYEVGTFIVRMTGDLSLNL